MDPRTHVVDEATLGRLEDLRESVSRQAVYSVLEDPEAVVLELVGKWHEGEWAVLCGRDPDSKDAIDFPGGLLIVVTPSLKCARGWLHTIELPSDLLARLVEWLHELLVVGGVSS